MNDDRLTTALGSFYKGTAPTPPDPELGLERVMTRVRKTRQRGRWWPLPIFGRAPAMPSAIPDPEYRSTPIPATNGHSPTVTGRTQSMFSPVKAITAGALVFAIGGAFLVAQPFQQQSSVPGAETDAEPAPPAEFTADYGYFGKPASGQSETLAEGLTQVTGEAWRWTNVESSDPRFVGDYTYTDTLLTYPDIQVEAGVVRIENSDGAWQSVPQFSLVSGPPTPGETSTTAYIGEDDYEGWVALVIETWRPDAGVDIRLEGYIFEGDLPGVPEPWSAE
jgi:hypothetical protein